MQITKIYSKLQKTFFIVNNWLNTKRNIVNLCLLILIAIFYIMCSSLTPYVYDDIAYQYCYNSQRSFFDIAPETDALINSFSDVLQSVWGFFRFWGGRIIPAFTIYSFWGMGKLFFNIVNGFMAAAVIYLICRHICGRKHISPSLLLLAASLFWLCAPAPGLTLLWANGAVIYLWTAFFYLLLLLPYRNFIEYGDSPNVNKFRYFYLFPIGIIACNANENIAASIVLLLLITMLFSYCKFRRVPGWMFCGFAGAAVGCIILFAAPGVYCRVSYEGYQTISVISNFFVQTAHLFHTIPVLFTAILLLIGCLYFQLPPNKLLITFFYFMLIITSGYSMIFSPYTPGRAVFGSFIFMLCLFGILFQQLNMLPKYRAAISAGCLAAALMSSAFAIRDIAFTNNVCRQRMQAMKNYSLQQKEKHWVFRPVCGISRYNALYKTDIIREDSKHFLNRHYARKYKQSSIRVTSAPALQGMQKNIFSEEQ